MIKVLHIVNALDGGGIENMLLNYYKEIDLSKYKFDFITHSENGSIEDIFSKMGSSIFYIPSFKNNKIKHIKLTREIIKNGNYDIVHSHMGSSSIFSMYYANKYKIKGRIVHSHLAFRKEYYVKNKIKKIIAKLLIKYTTDIFSCSIDAAKFLLVDNLKNTNYKVIKNAIDVEKFKFNQDQRIIVRKKLGIDNEFVVGNVARFDYQKNHEFLVDVFYEIHKKDPNTVLLLVGNGELEDEIRKKVEKLELKNSVKFLGVRNDVNELMQAMDVFLLPSRFEGLGIVFIEAQANGLTCFASDIVVPREAKVSDMMNFIPLDKSPGVWADEVLNAKNKLRVSVQSQIREAGYDIRFECKKLVEIYDSYK